MHATNGKGQVDHVAIAQAAAAERLAATVVVAFDACEDAGMGLSELQKIAILHVEATRRARPSLQATLRR